MTDSLQPGLEAFLVSIPGLWRTTAGPYSFASDIDLVVFPCCVARFKTGLVAAVARSSQFRPLHLWRYSRSSASLYLVEHSTGQIVHLDFYLPNRDYSPYGLNSVSKCPRCAPFVHSEDLEDGISILPRVLLAEYLTMKATYKDQMYGDVKRPAPLRRLHRMHLDWGIRLAAREFFRARRVKFCSSAESLKPLFASCLDRRLLLFVPRINWISVRSLLVIVQWIFLRRPLIIEAPSFRQQSRNCDLFAWLDRKSSSDIARWVQ